MTKGQNAAQSYGATKSDVLLFDPERVSIVYDSRHALYDKGMFNEFDIDIAKLPEGGEKHPCYDEEGAYLPLDPETMANIDLHGVLEAIAVRKNGERPDSSAIVETIYGRQRVKNLRAVNKARAKRGEPLYRIAAQIKKGDDAKIMGMWVSENAHRRVTSPLANARNIQRFLDYGRTDAEAAIMFKLTVQTIRANVSLLDLAPAVQKAVEKGQIKATLAAQEFTKIPREEQKAALEKLVESGAIKGAGAKEKVRQLRGAAPATSTERARPAKVIKKAIKTLAKIGPGQAEIAVAILKWVLGKPNCLVSFPKIEAALDPEPAAGGE